MMSNQQNNKGFTLIELMITMVVAAVVLALAAPSFTTMITNNRSAALVEDVASALNYTRSEAVKRGHFVSICASDDGATCSNDTAGWVDGYIAFIDDATSETATSPVMGTVLRVWDNVADGAVINATRDGTAIHFIRYTGLGTLARIDDKTVQIDSQVTNCVGEHGATISIGLSGMISISRKTCS